MRVLSLIPSDTRAEVICLELGVLVECFLELDVDACISCVLNLHYGDVGICEGRLG